MSLTPILDFTPFPPNLKQTLAHPETPWQISEPVMQRMAKGSADVSQCELLPNDPETQFITRYVLHSKPKGRSITKIICVCNSTLKAAFEAEIVNSEKEGPKFLPSWHSESECTTKAKIIQRWDGWTREFCPFKVSNSSISFSHAKVLPLFHGTTKNKSDSIFESGFTYFGKHDENYLSTDDGWYGSGIYFTDSADYASKYSDGRILLSWVSMRSPYPVASDSMTNPLQSSDMNKLRGKGAYRNYNAHLIPVDILNPNSPDCLDYAPCYQDHPPACNEYVVFQRSNGYPFCVIELAVDTPALQIKQTYSFIDGYLACQNGMLGLIQAWVKEDPSRLTQRGSKGETFMHAAALGGHLEVIQWLHSEDGSMVRICLTDGTTLQHIAAVKGYKKIAEWIHDKDPMQIKLTNTTRKTPLYYAALYQRIAVLEAFIDLIKKDPAFLFPLMEKPISNTIKYFLEEQVDPNSTNSFRQTLLHIAVQSGQVDNVAQLLIHHAHLEAKDLSGRTPLYLAVLHGHRSLVQKLMEKGASLSARTVEGDNVFHVAAFYGYSPILQDLLNRGQELVNAIDDDGKTPLHKACWGQAKEDIVALLIDHGADVHATNHYGYTPLHWAAKHGHRESVIKLIHAGARVDILNTNGDTPIDLMIQYKQGEILHLFLGTKSTNRLKTPLKGDTIQEESLRFFQAQKEGLIEEQVISSIKLGQLFCEKKELHEGKAWFTGSLVLISKLNRKNIYIDLLEKAIFKRLSGK